MNCYTREEYARLSPNFKDYCDVHEDEELDYEGECRLCKCNYEDQWAEGMQDEI